MRKVLAAAVAALSLAALADRAQAIPLTAGTGLKPAIAQVDPASKVRYCEYFDPAIGDWVVFWVPGPCYGPSYPGYTAWLGRYYWGGRYWRGRLGARPWVGGRVYYGRRGGVAVGPRGGVAVRRGGAGVYRGGAVYRGGGRAIGRAGGGRRR